MCKHSIPWARFTVYGKVLAKHAPAGCARADVLRGLGQLTREAACGQRKHQARDSAEEHADSHKRADDPFSARWPRSPNHDGKDQGDDSVE